MKILFLCGREAGYPFNQFLIDCFRSFSQVEVVYEHGPGNSILRRSLRVWLKAVPRLVAGSYDLVFIGFFGQLLMLGAGPFARRPVLFNPFLSAYETLVDDRQKVSAASLPGRLAFWLDGAACRRAAHMLMDTQANIDYLSSTFNLPSNRFTRVFVGIDERLFFPRPAAQPPSSALTAMFHGSYLPLHGIDVIIQAARLLNNDPGIRFRMVGDGLEYARIRRLAADLRLTQVDFIDRVPLDELPDMIAAADICFGGHFSSSSKARRAIAGKTFQYIAMGKPTIVGDNPANHELLTHELDAWFCPPADPAALAESIRMLAGDPALRAAMGQHARQTFLQQASMQVIAPQLQQLVQRMLQPEAG